LLEGDTAVGDAQVALTLLVVLEFDSSARPMMTLPSGIVKGVWPFEQPASVPSLMMALQQ